METEPKKKKRHHRETSEDAKCVYELIDVRHARSYFFRNPLKRDCAYDILTNRRVLVKKSAETEKFHTTTHFYDYEIPELVKEIQKP